MTTWPKGGRQAVGASYDTLFEGPVPVGWVRVEIGADVPLRVRVVYQAPRETTLVWDVPSHHVQHFFASFLTIEAQVETGSGDCHWSIVPVAGPATDSPRTWERYLAAGTRVSGTDFNIPNAANRIRAITDDASVDLLMRLIDGTGTTIAEYNVARIPPDGVHLGSTRTVELESTANMRVTFLLE